MRIRNLIALSVILVLGFSVLLTSTIPAQNQAVGNSSKLKALLKERRDTLNLRLSAVESLYNDGNAKLDRVIAAQSDLFHADLALASNKDERLAVLTKRLANTQENEKRILRLVEALALTRLDVLGATAARLEAEIELLREMELQN